MRSASAILFVVLALPCSAQISSGPQPPPTVADARAFLDRASSDLLRLSTASAHAEWTAETDINDDTETTSALLNEQTNARDLALIAESHRFDHVTLPPDLRRQIMLLQVNAPAAPSDPRLLAESSTLAAQLTGMYGKGKYCRDSTSTQGSSAAPPSASPGDAPSTQTCLSIDSISNRMAVSRDPNELLDLWIGWHRIAPPMRDRYARFVDLQNTGARELGYKDTGDLWRAGYDMSSVQFTAELEHAWTQLQPLYSELHMYVRHRLIQKYGAAADRPDGLIPAHLLGNMWAQEWGNIYDIVAPTNAPAPIDLEAALRRQIAGSDSAAAPFLQECHAGACPDPTSDAGHAAHLAAARDMVHYGENFFTSLGFAKLPETLWQRSQLVHPRDRDVLCHASAWDLDSAEDLRLKMCIEVNADYFTTVHHELGHNFYQRAYKDQPFLFRGGANDGFHEAIGDSIALSITPDYLKQLKLIDTVPPAEADIPLLLRTALDKVAFLPFGLLIDKWRWQVFSGETRPADYNKAWWELRAKYQGIAPPTPRSEADFDPGAKNHIPANVPYARYFLARIYQFQFYRAMCDASGYKGPLNRCSFYGSKAAGDKLNTMLRAGQSQPWQVTLKTMTGTDHLDAQPMLDYFHPLYIWLKRQNAAAGSR